MTQPSVSDIASALEAWAPPATAQSYDNVGLQVGRMDRSVKRGLVALDCTPAVVREAIDQGAELIVTHHPLLFRPLRTLTGRGFVSSMALSLAEAGIALYSIHTNLDSAKDGVSFALADQLGLVDTEFLAPDGGDHLRKLVVFVPVSHAQAVRDAIGDAGAGRIGAYEHCAFSSEGTGQFRPLENARPFIGKAGGGMEQVAEVRIESEVASWDLARVLEAMKAAHPYEQVAHDIYTVGQSSTRSGMGAVGRLEKPAPLGAFLGRLCDRLGTPAVRYVGRDDAAISRVAVCGGSGSDLVPAALAAGAEVFVTADVTYHRYFDVMDENGAIRMALVDAGHYETEAVTESLLADRLATFFPAVEWIRTSCRTGPVRTFTR